MNRIKTEMHAFWNVMEWLANTILFVWVGIALAFVLLEPSNPQLQAEVKFSHYLSPVDAGYAVVLYLWLLVSPFWWLANNQLTHAPYPPPCVLPLL
jgi:NhaP-type Na+/H+ or K+/H+ antiporter